MQVEYEAPYIISIMYEVGKRNRTCILFGTVGNLYKGAF